MKNIWSTKLPVEVISSQVPLTAYSWKFATWHTWQHQPHYPVEYHKSETKKKGLHVVMASQLKALGYYYDSKSSETLFGHASMYLF